MKWKVLHTTVAHGYDDGTVVVVQPGEMIELSEEEAARLGDNVAKAEEEPEKPERRRR